MVSLDHPETHAVMAPISAGRLSRRTPHRAALQAEPDLLDVVIDAQSGAYARRRRDEERRFWRPVPRSVNGRKHPPEAVK